MTSSPLVPHASFEAGDRERCINAGMDDYVTKPANPEELAAVVQRWLPQDAYWTEAT